MYIKDNIVSDTIRKLEIIDIDIDNKSDYIALINIIQYLTNGNNYFFNLFREDQSFFEDDELIMYRNFLPSYFEKNGDYVCIERIDNERFKCIGTLPVCCETFDHLIIIWKYYYGLSFFEPNNYLSWNDYKLYKVKSEIDGLNCIMKKSHSLSLLKVMMEITYLLFMKLVNMMIIYMKK